MRHNFYTSCVKLYPILLCNITSKMIKIDVKNKFEQKWLFSELSFTFMILKCILRPVFDSVKLLLNSRMIPVWMFSYGVSDLSIRNQNKIEHMLMMQFKNCETWLWIWSASYSMCHSSSLCLYFHVLTLLSHQIKVKITNKKSILKVSTDTVPLPWWLYYDSKPLNIMHLEIIGNLEKL